MLNLEKFLETTKGLQLLQEIERQNVGGAGDDEEEPDTSDSDNDQHSCQNCRQRRLRKQRRTRLRILLDEMSEQGHFPGSNSNLELRSASEATRDKYRAATQSFLRSTDKMKIPLASESELDAGLAQWMNMMYAEGHRAWQGERAVAGLLFFLPEYGKAGNKSIARSLRCLKGWRKLSPSFSSCSRKRTDSGHRLEPRTTQWRSVRGDAKSLPGARGPGVVPSALPDRLPVLPQSFPESDQQHRHRSGALPDAALRPVVGPRTGYQGHYVLPETRTLGDNDKSQAARTTRASHRLVVISPATQASCLTCEHDIEGKILAGKTCPLPRLAR